MQGANTLFSVMVRRAALKLTSTRRERVCASALHRDTIFCWCLHECNTGRSQCCCAIPRAGATRRRINAVNRSAVMCSRYVSVLSSFTPRLVDVVWQLSRLRLMFTVSSRFSSQLFRGNVADTVLASLNLNRHCLAKLTGWTYPGVISLQSCSSLGER